MHVLAESRCPAHRIADARAPITGLDREFLRLPQQPHNQHHLISTDVNVSRDVDMSSSRKVAHGRPGSRGKPWQRINER
jgi:hypothetical protein